MRPKARIALHVLLFYVAVIAFTFASTFGHELAHATAWDAGDPPEVRFESDRESAAAAIGQEKSLAIDGKDYRVIHVEKTTIALYPTSILAAGATLGLAPASVMPDHVLASTFYGLENHHYRTIAQDGEIIGWKESAMPMIVNAVVMVPIWLWLFMRPSAFSAAAAWVNASEWRFNLHHAQEIGIHPAAHYLGSTLVMIATVAAIVFVMARRWKMSMDFQHASVATRTA